MCGRYTQFSSIREILKVAIDPEVISFAGGLPNRELFPVEEPLGKAIQIDNMYYTIIGVTDNRTASAGMRIASHCRAGSDTPTTQGTRITRCCAQA